MASRTLTTGCIVVAICSILQIVGIATPYWFFYVYDQQSSSLNSGLLQICFHYECVSYLLFGPQISFHQIGSTALVCNGIFLQLFAFIIGVVHCRREDQRTPVFILSGFCFGAAGSFIGGIIWQVVFVYVEFINFIENYTEYRVTIVFSWSFGFSVSSTIVTGILAIVLSILACNMKGTTRETLQQSSTGTLQQQQQQQQPMSMVIMVPPKQG